MDFAKYVSFLDSKALFFPRSDKLDDPYEGAFSTPTWDVVRDFTEQAVVESGGDLSEAHVAQDVRQLREFSETTRPWTYVNSWHMNDGESAAMWDLYAKRDQGIAIQSTYAKFAACLPAKVPGRAFEAPEYPGKRIVVNPTNVYVGKVAYVDYETDPIAAGNAFYPYVHKRKSFKHESELRAVVREWPQTEDLATGVRGSLNLAALTNPINGLQADISIDVLVEKVIVAPTAPAWFGQLVENTSAKYGLDRQYIDKSRIYERRMF
jgi:hypothetical protein